MPRGGIFAKVPIGMKIKVNNETDITYQLPMSSDEGGRCQYEVKRGIALMGIAGKGGDILHINEQYFIDILYCSIYNIGM